MLARPAYPRQCLPMQIVLASASPRRRELLERAGVIFEISVSPAEEIHDASMKPELLCELNASLKAEAVAALRPEAVVIGSDTLVFIDDTPLGKPADLDEARGMLRRLAGRTHRVCTGVCVIFPDGERRVFHDTTEVDFLPLDEEDIENYLRVANPLDKAGAYGIQESGEMIIARISGSYENVMGLPVDKVIAALATESGCETRVDE
ncbi:MAG: Maf family protein [Verrucomicrobiota bacterium]